MAKALEFHNVSKSFGDLVILKDVNVVLNEGESMAVVGPSGAGKSTFLHLAGLMERPTGGAVSIQGQNTDGLSDQLHAKFRLNSIGFLFQFHHLLPDFNILENVLMPARLAGDDLPKKRREALDLLGQLGLSERLHHKPHELSGGEQQRAGLARALVRRPKLLLCDEPTGNLDHETAQHVSDLILSQVKREGVSAIIVTHNETLARRTDHVYHLENLRLEK